MDEFRYVVALTVILTVPVALVYWLAFHPFIAFWRRIGVMASYVTLAILCSAVLAAVALFRRSVLGPDLGTNPVLFAAGLIFVIVATAIGYQMRKQLTIRTMLGVPELKCESSPGQLITGGIYARIRHPRYVSLILGLLGLALLGNYRGAYLMAGMFAGGIFLLVKLEENELLARFGEPYREYCRGVPRFIPRT